MAHVKIPSSIRRNVHKTNYTIYFLYLQYKYNLRNTEASEACFTRVPFTPA